MSRYAAHFLIYFMTLCVSPTVLSIRPSIAGAPAGILLGIAGSTGYILDTFKQTHGVRPKTPRVLSFDFYLCKRLLMKMINIVLSYIQAYVS